MGRGNDIGATRPRGTLGRTALVLAGCCLFAAVRGTAPAEAQDQEEERPGAHARIDGFGGFAWGAGEDSLRAALGAPAHEEDLPSGLTVLVYRDSVGGYESVALYAAHDSAGLVKGQHTVQIGERDCEELFDSLRERIVLEYPLIKPEDRAYNDAPQEGLCPAVAQGEAGLLSQWKDPATGALLSVMLQAGDDAVQVVYESAWFQEWALARQQEAEEAAGDTGEGEAG